MDFSLTADQLALQDSVRRYLQDRYSFAERQKRVASGKFDRSHWQAFAGLGWLGMPFAEDVGGIGASEVELTILLEQFGRFLVMEPFLSSAVLAAYALDGCANAEQRQEHLPSLVSGSALFGFAHGEPDARGDVQHVRTQATRHGDGYVIAGEKSYVVQAADCDKLIVSARTSANPRDAEGISLFLIERTCPGIELRTYRTMDDGSASDIRLNDVVVGREALLGQEGAAFAGLQHATVRATLGACAEAVGAMDGVISLTADYLKVRRAYGTTLSSFQVLQHRLADMLSEMELSRSILLHALACVEAGSEAEVLRATSAAKALVARAGRFVGGNGIQLHGAMGMVEEYIVGHYFKRLTVIGAMLGGASYHLRRYATLQ